jgi:hypothetical protein
MQFARSLIVLQEITLKAGIPIDSFRFGSIIRRAAYSPAMVESCCKPKKSEKKSEKNQKKNQKKIRKKSKKIRKKFEKKSEI